MIIDRGDCMESYQIAISQMKSELLDIWINQSKDQSYADWYKVLTPKFKRRFQIEQMNFLLYSKAKKQFIAVEEDKNTNSIAYEWLLTDSKQACLQQLVKNGYHHIDDYILFENEFGEPLGILLLQSTDYWSEFSKTSYLTEFKKSVGGFLENIVTLNDLVLEGQKFKLLYKFTELFNSTMASETILDHVLETMQKVFPAFSAKLILSRDQTGMTYSYQVFDQLTEAPATVEAFLSGIVTTDKNEMNGQTTMNAPLKGRQGVYGVLQIIISKEYSFSSIQKNLIRMLANTAGNALENASLYNQSHRLINDLQLVNETSRKLNSGLPFTEMIAYLKQQLSRALLPDDIVFAFYNNEGAYELKESTSDFFKSGEGVAYLEHVSNYIQEGQDSLFDAHFSRTLGKEASYQSVIGLPILNQEEVIGFAVCLHTEKYFFSFDGFKLMRSLIMHASLSISNLQLRDRLQALAERDHLTGLYARRYMDRHIDQVLTEKEAGSFLLLDVDNFKQVNDQFGHDVGDQVLKQIAGCITEHLILNGIAARWGGEEFAIYLPEMKTDRILEFAEKLLQEIPLRTEPSVTVSIGGVNWASFIDSDFNELFKVADYGLYQAKEEGKNRFIAKDLVEVKVN